MSTIEGSASDPRAPWGVLGTGTPTNFPGDPPDPPTVVPSVGVQGVAADSPNAIAEFLSNFGDEPIVQAGAGAAVHGVRLGPPVASNAAPVESFGFLGGRNPFAVEERTGTYGQAQER